MGSSIKRFTELLYLSSSHGVTPLKTPQSREGLSAGERTIAREISGSHGGEYEL
jgi:hypothetical protein